MSAPGWEQVEALPTGQSPSVGYRQAGAPEVICASVRWSRLTTGLSMWLRSGPERPSDHTARACVLTEKHLYVERRSKAASRVPLALITSLIVHPDRALSIVVADASDVLLPPPPKALHEALEQMRHARQLPVKHRAQSEQSQKRQQLRTRLAQTLGYVGVVMLIAWCSTTRFTSSTGGDTSAPTLAPDRPPTPLKKAECKNSIACLNRGHCSRAASGKCEVGSDADCKASKGCREHGRCVKERTRCRPGSDADCQASTGCAKNGNCSQGNYSTAYPNLTTCVPASEEDCRKAANCKQFGWCSKTKASSFTRCRAKTKSDCANTKGCRRYGQCTPISGMCKVGSDADCKKAKTCKDMGWCSKEGNFCRAMTDADCAGSDGCKKHGRCKAGRIGDKPGIRACVR